MPDRLAQALDRAFAVTAALAEGQLSFGVLRERIGLPAPTFSRLLKALIAAGHITAGPNGYRLAPGAAAHARRIVGALELGEAVAPVLAELATTSGESAAFYALREGRVVLVAVHAMADSASYAPPGISVPEATRHGFVMACLMRADVAMQKRAFAACPRRRETTWTAFRDALADGRRTGAIIECGEHRPGILRVAAPVGTLGAIGVSSPRCTRAQGKALASTVIAAARSAITTLGVMP